MQILTTLYNVYASSGYGPQATSPQLAALAPDALSQALVARMMTTGTGTDFIAMAQVPDPTKTSQPRPTTLPTAQPWPPVVDIFFISAAGISFFESVPDPTNPPTTIT
jgi:hypothetical protein